MFSLFRSIIMISAMPLAVAMTSITSIATIDAATLPSADLGVSITPFAAGISRTATNATYSMLITNNGPSNATSSKTVGAVFTATLPETVTAVKATNAAIPTSCSVAGKSVTCAFTGAFPAKQIQTFTITISLAPATMVTGCTSTPAVITASARIDGSKVITDAVSANNTATSSTSINDCPGSLFVTATSNAQHQLLGGTQDTSALDLTFTATTEDVIIKGMNINPAGNQAAFLNSQISSIVITNGSQTIATAPQCWIMNASMNFCATFANGELVIPAKSSVTVNLMPIVKTDDKGARSNSKVQIALARDYGITAKGARSGMNYLPGDGDNKAYGEIFLGTSTPMATKGIVSPEHTVVLSKIASIVAVGPKDGFLVPGGLFTIANFNITSPANNNLLYSPNDIQIDGLIFTLKGARGVFDPSSFRLFVNDISFAAPCRLDATSSTSVQYVICDNLQRENIDAHIHNGDGTIFSLAAVVNNAIQKIPEEYAQVVLDTITNPSATSFGISGSHIRWLDVDDMWSVPYLWTELRSSEIGATKWRY